MLPNLSVDRPRLASEPRKEPIRSRKCMLIVRTAAVIRIDESDGG